MKLLPTETLLTGKWLLSNGHPVADEVCDRIMLLIKGHLRELGHDSSGWDMLYRDTSDGRLWELTFPQSELHGGGPPQLRCIASEEARMKYGDASHPGTNGPGTD